MATTTEPGLDRSPADGSHFFDPCPLHVLAECLRDNRWIDARTSEGFLQRVRIVEMIVRVEGEEIIFQQEWLHGDDDNVRRYRQEFTMDSDAIWRVLPTNYHIEQVKPRIVLGAHATERRMDDAQAQKVVACVVQCALFLCRLTREQFYDTANVATDRVSARHAAIVVIYEMTDLSDRECCEALGYKSPMPMQSARWKLDPAPNRFDARFHGSVARLGKLADAQLRDDSGDGRPFRRTIGHAREYAPVLT